MSDYTIRPVRPEDVAGLNENCFPRASHDEVHRIVQASLRGTREGRYVHLVAEADGEVVATVELSTQSGRARHRGELFRFVVSEKHRGEGIARGLLGAIRDEAQKMDIEMIDAAARAGTQAEDVYRKLGFVEFGRLPGGLVMDPTEVYDLVYFYLPVDQS